MFLRLKYKLDSVTCRFFFVVFEKATFFTTEELFTGKKTLQSKVFSAGVAGIADIRGLFTL